MWGVADMGELLVILPRACSVMQPNRQVDVGCQFPVDLKSGFPFLSASPPSLSQPSRQDLVSLYYIGWSWTLKLPWPVCSLQTGKCHCAHPELRIFLMFLYFLTPLCFFTVSFQHSRIPGQSQQGKVKSKVSALHHLAVIISALWYLVAEKALCGACLIFF